MMNEKRKKDLVYVSDDGTVRRLTQLEYGLYQIMREHPGKVLTRERLLHEVWGFQSAADTRTVDMCVLRLRKKIGPNRIQSIYGEGYLLLA